MNEVGGVGIKGAGNPDRADRGNFVGPKHVFMSLQND